MMIAAINPAHNNDFRIFSIILYFLLSSDFSVIDHESNIITSVSFWIPDHV